MDKISEEQFEKIIEVIEEKQLSLSPLFKENIKNALIKQDILEKQKSIMEHIEEQINDPNNYRQLENYIEGPGNYMHEHKVNELYALFLNAYNKILKQNKDLLKSFGGDNANKKKNRKSKI